MKIKFVRTCTACPEQYDVLNEYGNEVCYIRLRNGFLYAECPCSGGVTILEAEGIARGNFGGGCFESEEQRKFWLKRIAEAMAEYYGEEMVVVDNG